MSDNTKIEWADATWNPITGCTKVSPGCDHCYAERVTERFHGPGSFANVVLHPERLDQPLRWRRPRKVFVNSMSDLFHDDVPDDFIADVFAIMALAPQHTFQVLTKRHGRMRSLLNDARWHHKLRVAVHNLLAERVDDYRSGRLPASWSWPLPNVWLGVSVETQQWASTRVTALLDTPAAVRFLSCEPLLGPIDLRPALQRGTYRHGFYGVDWVIVGGESGPAARPMHPDWARQLRDQCEAAGVPFLLKQWGEYSVDPDGCGWENGRVLFVDPSGRHESTPGPAVPTWEPMRRVGKKAAGRELDGQTWDQYPEAVQA